MNTQASSVRLISALKSLGNALLSVADASHPNAGPQDADTSRLTVERELNATRDEFNNYFAELAQDSPVATERVKEQARKGRPLDQ